MGQIIFLLLIAFAIICAMYGLSQGVQIVQNGLARLVGLGRNTAKPAQTTQPRRPQSTFSVQPTSPVQRCLGELQTLHSLQQTGAITAEEYAQLKSHVLSGLNQQP
jgi:hypothetical protein